MSELSFSPEPSSVHAPVAPIPASHDVHSPVEPPYEAFPVEWVLVPDVLSEPPVVATVPDDDTL